MKKTWQCWLWLWILLTLGCNGPREREVKSALAGLSSGHELTVRQTIRSLSDHADADNIMAAVAPLIAVLKDPEDRHDVYTRSLAATALARIATTCPGPSQASPILEPLIAAMFTDPSENLRAAAAWALGQSGRPEVLSPLEKSSLSDPSILVRSVALEALKILTHGAYQPPSREINSAMALSSNRSANSRAQLGALTSEPGLEGAASGCLSPELKKWMDSHIIIFDPAQTQLPVCEP